MLNYPFPEYVYNAQGARNYLKTKFEIDNEIDTRADLRDDCIETELFEFTKEEINSVLSYLVQFQVGWMTRDLKAKIKRFGAYMGSDILFNLPIGEEVIKYASTWEVEKISKLVQNLKYKHWWFLEFAKVDNLDAIKWLTRFYYNVIEWNAIINEAIKHSSHKTIEWLVNNKARFFSYQSCSLAAIAGNLELVVWLVKRRQEPDYLFSYAAQSGNVMLLKWLSDNNFPCDEEAMDQAAEHGHLESVMWLHYNRTEGCTYNAINFAAMNGHVEVVKWLHENRTEGYTFIASEFAMKNDHLDVVKYLYSIRPLYATKKIIEYAVSNRNQEAIRWILDTYNFDISDVAQAADKLEIDTSIYIDDDQLCIDFPKNSPSHIYKV